MKYWLSKRRIAQVLVVVVMIVFAVRESRILWNVEGLEIFDLAYWGIYISDLVYTVQNLFIFFGGLIVLILLTPDRIISSILEEPPKVSSKKHAPKPKKVKEKPSTQRRRGRDKAPKETENPFEMVNKEWKPVFPKKVETPKKREKGKK